MYVLKQFFEHINFFFIFILLTLASYCRSFFLFFFLRFSFFTFCCSCSYWIIQAGFSSAHRCGTARRLNVGVYTRPQKLITICVLLNFLQFVLQVSMHLFKFMSNFLFNRLKFFLGICSNSVNLLMNIFKQFFLSFVPSIFVFSFFVLVSSLFAVVFPTGPHQ